MNKWSLENFKVYSKIILGLPVPHSPVAVSWQLAVDLRNLGYETIDTNRFDSLQVELIRNQAPYICVIHSSLCKPDGNNNSRIAFLTNLAQRFGDCEFRIMNVDSDFESSDGFPPNLQLWNFTSTDQIKTLIITQIQVWN
ncbi:MAG: hypothetical protein IPJ71_12515 [Bdellovibrionales bacterium]|nr:hypothetical protein [Bdellovibrionales bacterium]